MESRGRKGKFLWQYKVLKIASRARMLGIGIIFHPFVRINNLKHQVDSDAITGDLTEGNKGGKQRKKRYG